MPFKKSIGTCLVGIVLTLAAHAQQTCTVQVTTKDIADGTWFYLKDAETEHFYDSVQAKGNRFTLKAVMDKEATQAFVYEKSFDAYIIVWIAPGKLDIVQKGETLQTAIVTGNELEAHSTELKQLKEPLEKKIEEIEAKIEREQSEEKRSALMSEYKALNEKAAQTERDYVRKYPSRLYSAYILNVYKTTWGVDTTAALFNPMPAKLKQTSYGKNLAKYISMVAPSDIGDMAAEVKQPNPGGDTLSLRSLRGKWVLLEFWASWCAPCRDENPALKETYFDFEGKNFEILAVSLDTRADQWRKAIQEDGLTWKQVSELNGSENSAALTYSVNGIPDNFLIDPTGKIVAKGLRGNDLRKYLEKVL